MLHVDPLLCGAKEAHLYSDGVHFVFLHSHSTSVQPFTQCLVRGYCCAKSLRCRCRRQCESESGGRAEHNGTAKSINYNKTGGVCENGLQMIFLAINA